MATLILTVDGDGTYDEGQYGAGAWAGMNADDDDTTFYEYVIYHNGHKTWTFSGLPPGSTINSVKVYVKAVSYDATNSGKFLYFNGSSLYEGDYFSIPYGSSYTAYSVTWATNPLTGVAWTEAEINSAEFGFSAYGIGWRGTRCSYIYVEVDYTIVAPTVTTQAATNVQATSCTGNGNITATGGENCIRRGFCYKVGTSGDPTIADLVAYDDGDFGTGAFTKAINGLSTGTSYRVRAYAVNSAGTGYGTTVQILTKPAAPTNVAATDGVHTDKVVVTWTKSTGATGYRVYRDAVNASGLLGDVATYDDAGAAAPTITPGAAAASDGISSLYVTLSVVGESVANGTTHTYKVVAVNATGNSDDSSTNTGYRGHGSITYQWQRSAADSDTGYSNISGGTTDPYNDTGAPADGSGRWYLCNLNATGCTQQSTTHDRGYRKGSYIGFHSATAQRRYKASAFSTFSFPNPAGSGFTSANDGYYMMAGFGKSGILTAEALGNSKVNFRLNPSGIVTSETLPSPRLGAYLYPSGIASAASFGTALVIKMLQIVSATAIPTAEAFGTAFVKKMLQILLATAVPTAEAFGAASVVKMWQIIIPSGVASSEAFGTVKTRFYIAASGIISQEIFGAARANFKVHPSGIISQQVFGVAKVNLRVFPSGIISQAAFGNARFIIFVRPSGIATLQAFGLPIVEKIVLLLRPAGILSSELFGTVIVITAIMLPPVRLKRPPRLLNALRNLPSDREDGIRRMP